MSMPLFLRNEIIRTQEAAEAATPYDPSVATKVILRHPPADPNPQRTAVWDGNPWDRFDRKVVLAYTGNQDRIAKLIPEFARVGLNDVHVHWNFDNHFVQDLAFGQLPLIAATGMKNKVIFNNAYGHYSIIKTAYQLGSKTVLVMEDDIRFLRKIELISKSLAALPQEFDIAMLDSLHFRLDNTDDLASGNRINPYWVAMPRDEAATSAACYALSRNGMEAFIELYELNTIRPSDNYFNWERLSSTKADIRHIYIATPKIARQTLVGDSKTNTNYYIWSQTYYGSSPRKDYGK